MNYKRVSLIDKKISITTVYRTLKLFEESGIIERHDFKRASQGMSLRRWHLTI